MAQGFAVGSLVVTPTGRIARVEGYDGDGRCHVLYQDCDPRDAPLTIWPKFLRAANEAGQ